jgi:hypothetical protein
MAENNVRFNDCNIYGTVGSATGNIYLNGTTTAYAMGKNVQTDETTKSLYTRHTAQTFEYDGVTYETHVCLVAQASLLSATFVDFNGNQIVVNYLDGDGEPTDFAPEVAPVAINAAMAKVHTGAWELTYDEEWNEIYAPVAKVTYSEAFANGGAFVNLALTNGFEVYLYVSAEYYEFYSEATKALLSKETMEIGGVQFYYYAAAEINANQAYTNASFTVELTDGTNVATVNYDVTVAAYLEAALAQVEGDDAKLCYYIAKYLNDAYAYFTIFSTVDNSEATTLADLVAKYADLASDVERPEINTNYEGFAAMEGASIAVNLTCNPEFVIVSPVAGTVKFAGETYTLEAGKELRVSSLANRFDEVVTIVIGENTYTYCLGNYVANVEADEASPATLKALVASLYNYILFASKF